jgi:hypothetical protein
VEQQQQQQRCIFSLLLTAKVFCLFPSVVVSLPPAFFNAYYNSACVHSSPQGAGFIQRASRGNDDAATAIINVGN